MYHGAWASENSLVSARKDSVYHPEGENPELDLVVVFEASDAMALALAKGSLEEAGIPFVALDEISTLIESVDPFLHKRVRIQVARDCEEEAREALMPLLYPAPSD